MLALHAIWRADQRLALWAEDVRRWQRQPAFPRQPAPLTTHPYALDGDGLRAAIAGIGPGLGWLAGQATTGTTTLLLPTRSGTVLPSPELCGPAWASEISGAAGGDERCASTLVAWTVPGLLLACEEAAQLLGELWPTPSTLGSRLADGDEVDVWLGASLRWLTRAHDLAWRTVHRGRVLPSLVGGSARWVAVPDAGDWQQMLVVAAVAPPVVRAEQRPSHPGGRPAADVLTDVLAAMVDAEVRLELRTLAPLVRPGRSAGPTSPTAAEAWLGALVSTRPTLRADEVELRTLESRIQAWHRSEPAPAGPVRACFRLVEPVGADDDDPVGGPSDTWSLELLLQPTAEPSLLVDAADVWGGGPAMAGVNRSVPWARDLFEEEIARAARLCPLLRFALRDDRPGTLTLDREGAVQFLSESAPDLLAAGFGVFLPTWWGHGTGVGMVLVARTAGVSQPGAVETTSVLDRDVVVSFNWRAAIGGLRLSEDDLHALAAAGQRLVRLRGRWVEVDHSQVMAALAFLAREQSGTLSVADLLRVVIEPPRLPEGVPFGGVDAEGWLGELFSGAAEVRTADVAVPDWFGATLRPYQQRGLDWLQLMSRLGLGAVLADDMGLGKTTQLLALLAVERAAGASGTTLVVCPMSLVGNWQRETARFAPRLRVHVHHGAQRLDADGLAAAVRDADVVVTTYGLVQRDVGALASVTWRRVVLDEAQHVKNSATQQAKAVRALPASHRVALTGTPVENRLADLHAILDQSNPGMFGSPAGFKDRYAAPIERDGNEAALAALRRLTAPFVLRRLKTDPAIARDLPDKQEMTVWCNLTAEQAGLYRAVVADMVAKLRERRRAGRRGVVLSALTRLKQVCDAPSLALGDSTPLAGRSGKVARLEEILEVALAEGDKALCFTQYAAFGAMLAPHLARRLGVEVLFLHGGSTRQERDAMVARFQAGHGGDDGDGGHGSGGPPVMLLSLRAGGVGLNLTAANQVIHVDRWWNPAVEDQATDRAFRIGQRRDVQVRRLICVGTLEERIDAMISGKRALAGSVMAGGEDWLSDLSTDALAELVALSADAVSEQDL